MGRTAGRMIYKMFHRKRSRARASRVDRRMSPPPRSLGEKVITQETRGGRRKSKKGKSKKGKSNGINDNVALGTVNMNNK
jgi:hypothetical protein